MNINKSALVYAAIINYKKEVQETCALLSETIKNPAFKDIKGKFADVKEIELFEVFIREPSARRRGVISSGMIPSESVEDKAVRQLKLALEKINITDRGINKSDVAKLAQAITELSKVLENQEKDSEVRKAALLPLSKAYMKLVELTDYFKGKDKKLEDLKQRYERLRDGLAERYEEKKEEIEAMFDPEAMNQLINAKKEMQKIKLNPGAARAILAAAEEKAAKLEPEISEYEERLKGGKRGLFGRILGKLGLEEQKKINEAVANRWCELAGIKILKS